MNVPGLMTVQPGQTALLDRLADMVGLCFLEERWHIAWLSALDVPPKRKLAITRAVIRSDYRATAPYGCVHALPDEAGAANAFLRSDLADTSWEDVQARSAALLQEELSEREREILNRQARKLEAASDTDWPARRIADGEDYLYFYSIGVDPAHRGTGAFNRLMTPFLLLADERGVRACLDCYSDRLEGLYGRYGFKVVERKSAPGIRLTERCMVREPGTPLPHRAEG